MAETNDGLPGRRSGPLFPSLRRRRRKAGPPAAVVAGLVLVLLAGGAGWYWLRSRVAPDPQAPGPAAADAAPPAAEAVDPPLTLPPLGLSDELVRAMVGALSSHPQLAGWLVTDDLVRRFVAAVVNVAGGSSPAVPLDFLTPAEGPSVRSAGGTLRIDPASYRRYDLLTETFVSVDADGGARLYHQLHPLFVEAYQELDIPEHTFDEMMAMAVGNLLAVEVPGEPLEVTRREAFYEFADPRVEALTPAEKHLLRLGPENAGRVQEKLQELALALEIAPAEVPAAR